MADHLCPWRVQHRAEVEASRAAFEARHDFAELVAEADRKGYRRIELFEQLEPGTADAYTWRGGVWVKRCK
jgi:hypothetical protein